MQPIPGKKSLLRRQIPTLIGLGILVVGLVAGMLFIGQGAGVFAPRATPQTTPKLIKITNVSDTSFTASFLTDEATVGFVKYGTEPTRLNAQASDDRDQLSGTVGKYSLHHITVRGLDPATTYYFTLGTASTADFDNNGSPFTVTTAKRGGTPSAAKTSYGSVVTSSGTPAEGSVVYVTINGVGELSSLVKNSGSWAVPLSNARTSDGANYAKIEDTDSMGLMVQGPSAAQTSQLTVTVKDSQPVAAITLGQNGAAVAAKMTDDSGTGGQSSETSDSTTQATDSATTGLTATSTATGSGATGGLNTLLSQSDLSASGSATTATSSASPSAVVNLESTKPQVVTTTQPVITGKAAPNVRVRIEVHSDNQINYELVADANGGFTLDVAKLSEQLEPGEHTVTYAYTDPTTGQEVVKTQTFTVQAPTNQLAQATTTKTTGSSSTKSSSPSPTPFSSSNPFPVGGASGSATPKPSPSSSPAASGSSRVAYPSTSSGIPVSGTLSTTIFLVAGGLVLMLAGTWSFWMAKLWTTDDGDPED